MALIATNINIQLPCLTAIKSNLRTTEFMIQLSLVLGPSLAIISNIFFGLWCDRFNPKTLLIYCIILFLTGSSLCALSFNIWQFFLGRALQVLGDSGVSIIGFIILSNLCNNIKLGEYLGYNIILNTAFGICSPLIGAYFLIYFSWRMNFALLSFCSFILLILLYFSLSENYKTKNPSPISLKGLWREYILQIQRPIFSLAVIIPALYATVTSLQEFYSPIFYIEIYGVSPQIFAYIRVALIAINIIAAFLYIYIIKRKGIKLAFIIGVIWHALYTIGITATLLTSNHHQPYLLFVLAGIQYISADFINPIGMITAISCFPNKKGVSLSMFALIRNIVSACLILTAAFAFNESMRPIIVIIEIISIVLCYLLFIMYSKLFKRAIS